MALVIFLGRPGSGKTYSAMADYILPAIEDGRRVVHNIAGFGEGVKFGDNPIFPKVNFHADGKITFEHDEDGNPARIRGGDMVVIDEWYLVRRAHQVANSRTPSAWLLAFHDFLRAHRHYVGDNGFACDILLLAQTDHDIEDAIKLCAERTHIMKTYALARGYLRRLDYDGGQQRMAGARGNNCLVQDIFKPRPAIYNRYASYTAAGAVKERIRGFSFLKVYKSLVVALSLMGLGICYMIYFVVGVIAPDDLPAATAAPPAAVAGVSVERLPESRVCALRLQGKCFYDRIAINRGISPRDKKE